MKYFFIIVFLIYTLVNSYIFYRGWQALPSSPLYRIIYIAFCIIVYSSFIIAMLGRATLPLGILKILYSIGTTWLACMLYLTLFFLLTDIVHLLNHFFHFLPNKITENATLFHQIQLVSGSVLVVILLFVGYYRFSHPVVETYNLKINKHVEGLKQLKILGISDIHLGLSVDKKRLSNYIEWINRQKPDLILIAGDVVDNHLRPLNAEKMYEELNRLEAPLGIFACPGNHEYISGMKESLEFFRKTNIQLLADSAVCVDHRFWIIGRDDRSQQHRKALKELISETDITQPLFLMDHQPYHLEEAQENGIDLQLSGHTHEGQLWPFNLLVRKMYELGHGYKQKGKTHVYTSSGLALWGPSFRIGTQSELVVFNIQFD